MADRRAKEDPLSIMRKYTREEYLNFLTQHESVQIETTTVKLIRNWRPRRFQPDSYRPEEWTVWSFPDRGDWATHVGNYRGNWSPYIPRNLIDRYTIKGDKICDPMMGSGTTMVECQLMGRDGIGLDVNPDSVMVAMNRLDFKYNPLDTDYKPPNIMVYQGDARNLNEIPNESVDLVATHPPYCGIVKYAKENVLGDLSQLKLPDFIREMGRVASESFRVLKPNHICAILIGDTRTHLH